MTRSSARLHGKRNGNLRLLITGASGLLGSKLATHAIDAGHEVYSIYSTHMPSAGNPQRMDITDEAAVNTEVARKSPDVVIHCAALTDVDLCERNPELAMRVNSLATRFLGEACEKIGSFLTYVSTDYVFDGAQGHYSEGDKPNPINTYGRSKVSGEQQLLHSGSDFCIARTSVVYGWGREHRPNFAAWIYSRLSARQNVNVVTDQYASPTLNSHLARMLLEVAERRLRGTYHLAGSTRASRYQFAILLARRYGFDENLLIPVGAESVNWTAKRPPDSSLNVGKAREMLNNKPITIAESLEQFAREAPHP